MAESWAAPATPRLRARPRPGSSARGLLELRDAEPGWLGALGPKVPRSDQERGDFRRAAGRDGTSRGPSRLACPAAPACGSASRKVCAQPRSMSPPPAMLPRERFLPKSALWAHWAQPKPGRNLELLRMPSGYRGNTIRRRQAVQSEPAASPEPFPRWGPGEAGTGRGGQGPTCREARTEHSPARPIRPP